MHLDHERARLSRGGSAACSSPRQGSQQFASFLEERLASTSGESGDYTKT